jgi:hypothetical protein
VFAHFGMDNIRDKTIVEAVNTPFFKAIRREVLRFKLQSPEGQA